MGQKADPNINNIKVDGFDINVAVKKIYLLLNKPSGYTCTTSDPYAEKTVIELIKEINSKVFPVGRLDKNTTGLLVLTNDGDFANNITHPSKKIEKTYLAHCLGRVSEPDLDKIRNGIELFDGKTSTCKAEFKSYNKAKNLSTIEITIHEGKKRQVRRMFSSIEHTVKHLSRIKLGPITLKGLKEGTYRKLTRKEIEYFKS